VAELKQKIFELEDQLKTLKDQNDSLQSEVKKTSNDGRSFELLRNQNEMLKKSEEVYKSKVKELEEKFSREESKVAKKDNEIKRLQEEVSLLKLKKRGDEKGNFVLRDHYLQDKKEVKLECPLQNDMTKTIEEDFASPILDEKSRLKIDDLKKPPQGSTWKLQITDAKNEVFFEEEFVDRNFGERDFPFEANMPHYDHRDQEIHQWRKEYREERKQETHMPKLDLFKPEQKRDAKVFSNRETYQR